MRERGLVEVPPAPGRGPRRTLPGRALPGRWLPSDRSVDLHPSGQPPALPVSAAVCTGRGAFLLTPPLPPPSRGPPSWGPDVESLHLVQRPRAPPRLALPPASASRAPRLQELEAVSTSMVAAVATPARADPARPSAAPRGGRGDRTERQERQQRIREAAAAAEMARHAL